jgi:bifunctional non-homologous end joining protein LigD
LERPPSSRATKPRTNGAKRASNEKSGASEERLELTHPDKILYPDSGITKRELALYFARVSEWMLPHVADRPLTLVRCPEGNGKSCFFQKHANAQLPPGVRAIPIRERQKEARYMAVSKARGLLDLAQMGVLEVHTWGAHADDPEKPDLLVFDLDPDVSVEWAKVIEAARLVRERLEALGLTSFVKTTGGKGLHVCVPIVRRIEWDGAKEFCRKFSEAIVASAPDEYVATASKARRKGKIFIDFLRNARGATFIAPYSTRARPGAPVAVPLGWDELSENIPPDHFDVRSLPARLQALKRDPWREMPALRQSLSARLLRRFGI